jgi:hypothetical protein
LQQFCEANIEVALISLVSIAMLLWVLARIARRRCRKGGPPVAPIQDLLDYLVRPAHVRPANHEELSRAGFGESCLQVVVLAVVDLMFYMPELIFAMDYKVIALMLTGGTSAESCRESESRVGLEPQAPPFYLYLVGGGQDKVFMIYSVLREVRRAGAGAGAKGR